MKNELRANPLIVIIIIFFFLGGGGVGGAITPARKKPPAFSFFSASGLSPEGWRVKLVFRILCVGTECAEHANSHLRKQ